MGGCEQCEGGAEFGECMLRIGVGRAFAPRDHEEASCWLQVNAIYPIEDEWPHFYREPAALALTG
jgi:hypothetical protein